MRYAVVFTSKTGNTRHLAEGIRKQLGEEECGYFGVPDAADLQALWTSVSRALARESQK